MNETQEKIIKELEKNGYTDGVDISIEISFFEYGIIRNPKTNKVLYRSLRPYCLTDGVDIFGYDWTNVEINDVIEALEEIENGFYDYIGSDKETELKHLDNEDLSYIISSINNYNGYFNDSLYYDTEETEVLDMI